MKIANPRLLLICKNYFQDASRLAMLGDDLSIMKAVIFIDFAIEQLLNLLINEFHEDADFHRDDVTWNRLWQCAKEAVKKRKLMNNIPNYRQLKTLREVRNLLQHRGVKPHAEDVSIFAVAAEETLERCFWDCYGLNFKEYKLWDVIKNAQLRQLLTESEMALKKNKPAVCLAGSKLAFNKITSAIRNERLSEVERFASNRNYNFHLSGFATGPIFNKQFADFMDNFSKSIGDEIRKLRDDSEVANIGLSMAETRKFRSIVNLVAVSEAASGILGISQFHELDDKKLIDYAESALDYLSKLVLLAQEVHPSAIAKVQIQVPLSEQSFWEDS